MTSSPPLPLILGGYGTIVADPPWEYTAGKATRIKPPYPTMSEKELRELPIESLASDRALLFIWATHSFTVAAYRLCWRWGFRPVSQMVWVKMGESGKLRIGLGSYVRIAHELVVIGERGGQTGLVRNVPSVVIAPRGRHSEKPEEFYKAIEPLAPRPRLEMFARRRRAGWRTWGNECPEEETNHGNNEGSGEGFAVAE